MAQAEMPPLPTSHPWPLRGPLRRYGAAWSSGFSFVFFVCFVVQS